MNLTQETVKLLTVILGSVGFSTGLGFLLTRKKTMAETQNLISKTYSDMLDNLRKQVELQGEQINALQLRETQYLKLISDYNTEKTRLIAKHTKVEKELNLRIKTLELKLSNYIKNN